MQGFGQQRQVLYFTTVILLKEQYNKSITTTLLSIIGSYAFLFFFPGQPSCFIFLGFFPFLFFFLGSCESNHFLHKDIL